MYLRRDSGRERVNHYHTCLSQCATLGEGGSLGSVLVSSFRGFVVVRQMGVRASWTARHTLVALLTARATTSFHSAPLSLYGAIPHIEYPAGQASSRCLGRLSRIRTTQTSLRALQEDAMARLQPSILTKPSLRALHNDSTRADMPIPIASQVPIPISAMAVVAVTATWLLWNLSALGSVTAADATLGTTELVFATVMAVSAFAQALTGFGFAIISVGCLSSWLVTSPLFALVTPIAATLGAVVGAILLLPDVKALDWDELIPLLLPCTLLTPGGVWLATIVNPSQVNSALGVLILAFVTFLFADAELPPFLASKQAAYLLGAVGGVYSAGPTMCRAHRSSFVEKPSTGSRNSSATTSCASSLSTRQRLF